MRGRGIAAVLAVVILAALPVLLSSYAITVFIFIFFYAYLGQAWNIVGGYAGQLSAGHAAFVGVGAYTSAVLSMKLGLTPWIGRALGSGRHGNCILATRALKRGSPCSGLNGGKLRIEHIQWACSSKARSSHVSATSRSPMPTATRASPVAGT